MNAAAAPWAVRAGVFLACYLAWRPVFSIMFTASDVLFLLGAWVLLARGRIPAEPMGSLTALWFMGVAAMLTGLLMGSMAGQDPSRWTVAAVQYGFAWVVLPFLLVGHGRPFSLSLARSLLWGVVAMELFGVLVFLFYGGGFQEAREQLGLDFISGGRRLGAFATDANWNGAAVAMTLPVALFLGVRRAVAPVAAVAAVAVLVTALVMSASFTAFMGAVAALAIFAVAGAVRPKLWAVLLLLGAAGAAVQTDMLPAAFQKRVADAIEQGDISEAGTYQGRVELIKDAWVMAGDHLAVGVGVDQHRVESRLGAPVHNMYLLLLVEGGLLALAGWLAMMVALVASAWRTLRHDRLAAALALSVLAAFLIFSTASPHMYARLWAVPVLVAVGVARAAAAEGERARPALARGLARRLRFADA